MRAIRFTFITTIAIGLLAGSAVGVGAQDDAAAAPVEFTAKLAFGPSVRSETTTIGDGVTMTSGGAWRAGVITEASDPRLQGTTYMAANSNDYSAIGGPIVWNYAFRIENDEGAWQQQPTLDLDFTDGSTDLTRGVMLGEGGYEGLTAVFQNVTSGGTWDLHGYIIDGELTPEPEPYVTE
jgi:hypothetical protein